MRKAYKEQKGDAEVTRGLLAAGSEGFLYMIKAPEERSEQRVVLPSEMIGYYYKRAGR